MSDVAPPAASNAWRDDGREARWRPVVYARTHRADQWWRVRPLDWNDRWLSDVVLDVVAGGEGLEHSPRFALFRHQNRWLVGVASMAGDLDPELSVAVDSRPLYAFAGWASNAPRAATPSFQTLREHWTSWAGELYTQWLLADWFRHPSELRAAGQAPAVPAPWAQTSAAGVDPDDVWARAVASGVDFVSILDLHSDPMAASGDLSGAAGVAKFDTPATEAFDAQPVGVPQAPAPRPQAMETYGSTAESRKGDADWRPDDDALRRDDQNNEWSMPRLPRPGRLTRKIVDRLRGEDPDNSESAPDSERAETPRVGPAKDLQYWRDNARSDHDRRNQPPKPG